MGSTRAALSCLIQCSKARSLVATVGVNAIENNFAAMSACTAFAVAGLLQALTFTLVAAYSLSDDDNGQHPLQLTHQASSRPPLPFIFG